MKEIIKALKKESEENLKYAVNKIDTLSEYQKTKEEALKFVTERYLDKKDDYKGTYQKQKEKTIKALTNKYKKALALELAEVEEIKNASDFKGNFVITVEWKKSYMWGNNPTAYTSEGFEGSSIGGCGYCKSSTATAQALNSHLPILKLLYLAKEKVLRNPKKFYVEQNGDKGTSQNHINVDTLGYGTGHGIRPRFEGGVGVSCHEKTLEKLGFTMRQIGNAKTTDVYTINKKDVV